MSETSETTHLTAWRDLCEAFTTDPALYSEVSVAESPWLALIDWLDRNDRLVELDAANSSEDLADYLATLPLLERIDLTPVAAQKVALGFAVPRANAILARNFYTLLLLDIGTDSYPLALVSTEAAPRIHQLAASLGHVARTIDETDTTLAVAGGAGGYTAALPFVAVAPTGPRPVNFGKRLLAFVIDAVLLYGVALGGVGLGILANGDTSGESGVVAGVLFATLGVYLVGLAVLVGLTGRSLGMWVLGLKLVRVDNGQVPGIWSAAGRGALVVLFVLWIWALVVFITTLIDPNGRGLADKAAGTIMIDTRRPVPHAV